VRNKLIDAPNSYGLDDKVPTSERNVFQCPAGTYSPGGTGATSPDFWKSQGFWRSGTSSAGYMSQAFKIDCWYYWNGSSSTTEDDDVPSWRLGGAVLTTGSLESVRRSSQVVMLADGYGYDGHKNASGKNQIAARHWGARGNYSATNIAFYDGHVETLDRNPTKTTDDPITKRPSTLKSKEPPFFRISDQ